MQWITTYFLENLEFKSHTENGFEKTTVKTTDLTATTSTPYSALKMGRNCAVRYYFRKISWNWISKGFFPAESKKK